MSFNITLVQKNSSVADPLGTAQEVLTDCGNLQAGNVDLVIFPEMAITGYPPEDLLLRKDYLAAIEHALFHVMKEMPEGIDAIVGAPLYEDGRLFNAALHIRRGKILNTYRKRCLPNYGVFDEQRYFTPGEEVCLLDIAGHRIGLTICEDLWDADVIAENKQAGADLIVNISASPFDITKEAVRTQVLQSRNHETGLPIVYANLVGGQDELVFDGRSSVINASGDIVLAAPAFEEGIYSCDPFTDHKVSVAAVEEVELIHKAVTTGLRCYTEKSGAQGLLVGLSGGIDSAVSLQIAVAACGADKVKAVTLPSPYTAPAGIEDSRQLADNLGVDLIELPISEAFSQVQDDLNACIDGKLTSLTLENVQARLRACLLMAMANQYDLLVVSTSNKSEIAVGYTTLYGDMIGGYVPLKDVSKTRVYALADYYNRKTEVIPQRIIERAPTAELAPGQKDTDSLPPYSELDPMLEALIEEDVPLEELLSRGFDSETVEKVGEMVASSEYKRRQAVPGVKITPRAFGRDRRYPLSYRYYRFGRKS